MKSTLYLVRLNNVVFIIKNAITIKKPTNVAKKFMVINKKVKIIYLLGLNKNN